MNLWSIAKIKGDLFNQKANQRDLLVYYFLSGLVYAILILPVDSFIYFYYQKEIYSWIEWGFTNFIFFNRMFLCYQANRGNMGKNFIERIFSLETILTIRYLVFFQIPYEIFHLVFLEETAFSDIGNLMASIIFWMLVSIRSIQCMKDIQ